MNKLYYKKCVALDIGIRDVATLSKMFIGDYENNY
jgi:hypothetical protein